MADPISKFFSYLGTISVPKAENLLTAKTISGLANKNNKLLTDIGTLTGTKITVPPKATTLDQIAGYLSQGANFINTLTGAVSTIQPKTEQVSAPFETIKIGGVVTGATAAGSDPQVYPGDKMIVIPGAQTTTQGSQAGSSAPIDMTWIIWLIVAILVLAGVYVVTKGK